MQTTVGQLMVNEVLPEDLQDRDRVLDKKGISNLLREVAQKHPEKYREISHRLNQIGWRASQESGGYSFGLRHMQKSKYAIESRKDLQNNLDKILGDEGIDDKTREAKIIKLVSAIQQAQQDPIYDEAMAADNPLAYQVLSGSRGNKMNLASLLGSDLLYSNHRDQVIPVPVLRSYSEGLTPAEYWAGTYGARKGVMATKFATQEAGFLCLGLGTLVRMADYTVKRIENVQVGDTVLGASKDGMTFPVRVSACFDNGVREVSRYRFRVGKSRNGFEEIVATEDHNILAKMKRGRPGTPHGDKNSILEPTKLPLRGAGHGFRAVLSKGFTSTEPLTHEPRAAVVGLLLAEGGLTGNNTNFSTGDPQVVAAAGVVLKPLGFRISKRNNKDYEFTIHDEQPIRKKRFGPALKGSYRCRLRKWLSEINLLGKLAPEKHMPEEAYSWDNESVRQLLAFLFEGDGWVTETNHGSIPIIGLGMTARPVVEAARDLLAWRFGIHSTPVIESERDGRNVFVLQIATRDAVGTFAEMIPMPGVKGDKLRKLMTEAEPATRDDGEFLLSYADKEYLGLLPTYDLEVDHEDHLFVLGNGMIVSNSKQLNQVAHRLVVSALDRDGDGEPDSIRGMPADTSDMDNEGALLARDVGPYKRNTTLTPKILKELHRKGHERILVRSPIVGGTPEGGVYARDVGVRETGSLPGRGEVVGLAAAQALSEPLSQAQLSAKHSGGVAGEEKSLSGFDYINAMVQVPKKMKGGAAHAEVDGVVSHITDAPAGGKYVTISGEQHYVADGFDLTVKKGDRIEAGDTISDGIPNPAKVVEHKGVGEGRRYFIGAFQDAMKSAGLKSHRRNVELLSRGLINHVKLQEEMGNYVPDDVVPYSTLEHIYEPRQGFEDANLDAAVGKYLERPIMHHTIGTKVRPSMLKDLKHFGVQNLTVHKDPPPFQAEMIRGMYSLQHDPDWMTRMYGSGLKGSVLKATHRGQGSNEKGTSFVPGMSQAVNFGREGLIQPPEPFKFDEEKQGELEWGTGKPATVTPGGSTNKYTPAPTQDPIKPINNQAPGVGNVPNAKAPTVSTAPPTAQAAPKQTMPVSTTKTQAPTQATFTASTQLPNLDTPPTEQTQPTAPPRYYSQNNPAQQAMSNIPFLPQIQQGVMSVAPQLGPMGAFLSLASLDPSAMMGLLRGPGGQPSLPTPQNPQSTQQTAGGLAQQPARGNTPTNTPTNTNTPEQVQPIEPIAGSPTIEPLSADPQPQVAAEPTLNRAYFNPPGADNGWPADQLDEIGFLRPDSEQFIARAEQADALYQRVVAADVMEHGISPQNKAYLDETLRRYARGIFTETALQDFMQRLKSSILADAGVQ